jgi:PKD repeat protein
MIKNLISIFSLVIVISFCLSCDGRDRIHKSSETVLKENKLLDSFSEQTVYIPDGYAEKVTDTIFANGYHIYTKQYTTNSKDISVITKQNSIQTKTIYKDFKVDLKVSFKGKLLHSKILASNTKIIYEPFFDNEDHNYMLRNIWTDSSDRHHPDSPTVFVELYNPKTLDSKNLKLSVLKDKILTTSI